MKIILGVKSCILMLFGLVSSVVDVDTFPMTSHPIPQHFLTTGGSSGTGSGCPPNYTGDMQLVGVQVVNSHFETPGIIHSDQIIQGNITVEYDAGRHIELLPGFEVQLGVTFEAYIDGCTPELP